MSNHTLIDEIESIPEQEMELYMQQNENIRFVKQELDRLISEFKIVNKVGGFDDFYDREAPQLIAKIKEKRSQLSLLIEGEKKQKFEIPVPSHVPDSKATPASPIKMPRLKQREGDDRFSFAMRRVIDHSDSNMHTTFGIILAAVVFQFAFNYIYLSRSKSSLQNAALEALDTRFKNAEYQNELLQLQVKNLQAQLDHLTNKNFYGAAKKKQIAHIGKNTRKPASN
ncbi:MAG: hypothetical protein ACXVAX_10510 [Pseudobdellovibrio sp.]